MNRILTYLSLLFFPLAANCQTADFTYQSINGVFCEPSTIQFTHTATGTPTEFIWTFGNNTGSNLADPATTYPVAGTYTVTLIVVYDQTAITVTKTIVINPAISLSVVYDRNYICTPGPVTLTATSNGNISTYQWDWGDGSGISSSVSNISTHNYTFGNYYALVKATDIYGCFKTATVHVVVEKPTITGTVSPRSGCIPTLVNFNANVLVPVSGSVTTYTWDFGDGSPLSTTGTNNITHTYTAVGTYLPTLSIVTNEGCTNNFSFPSVAYGIPPAGHVAYPKKTVICGSETAQLVSKAVNANSYTWDYGDGIIESVPDTLAQHKYTTLGTKNITVTPYFNGCAGVPISFSIDVVGVISGYTYSNTCSNRKQYSFINTSQGNLSTILWSFGDGSPDVNTVNAVHSFPPVGEFRTSLRVTDNITGCMDEYSTNIYTADPSLNNPDTAICKNNNTSFTIINNYTNAAALYTWHVAGMVIGPNDSSNITIHANILGNYNNDYVIIDNGQGYCPDTIQLTKPLLVKGPNLGFTSPNSICFKSPYAVTNTSQPYVAGETITSTYWTFGIIGVYNDSAYQPQPYSSFYYPGTWDIILYEQDINGCKDSLHKILTVNPIPFLFTFPAIDTICQGQADTLTALHSDNITWSPTAGLSCATCDTVIANPNTTTNYYISVTNSFSCTAKDSILIKVYTPFTATATPADSYTCTGVPVQLNISPPSKIIVWSPATGLSNPDIYNPVAEPVNGTIYTATLTDSAGCFTSTATANVHIKALPTVDAGPDMTYPYNTNFTFSPVYSSNVANYLWEPAASLSCSNCAVPGGISNNTQTYTITVTSDSGCVAKDNVTIFVECKDANLLLPGAFTPNGDGLNDYYYPMARGIKQVLKFSIYNRQGQLVFEARDFAPNIRSYGWDGKLKGMPQEQGAYVYNIETVCEVGQRLNKKGSFMLVR